MKLILAQPSIKRFQWELEVLLTNIKQFGKFEVVLLFSKPHDYDDTVPRYLSAKYGVQCFVYDDKRFEKSYIPSIRPYLWWQYLRNDPSREHEQYFYIDSDIIFRQMIDFATLGADAQHWVGSDCSGYIAYDYIKQCRNGEQILQGMAAITGITVDQMKGVPGIGAHLLLTNPTAAFWERAFEDSNRLWQYLSGVDSNVQKWTAEMWAQLWGMVREGKTILTPKELDFCMATDPIEKYDQVKIMHNAGATGSDELFFKGKYINSMPFNDDLSYVNPQKCSRKYVEALQKVVL